MNRMRKGVLVVVLAALTLAGTAWAQEKVDCDRQKVNPIPIVEAPTGGRATFCVTREGLTAQMRVRGLVPGNAYTVWWVYFDDPSLCVDGGPGVCGPADFHGNDPLAVLGRMDSGVAKSNGRLRFSGHVRGMRPSPGSEVELLVFGHGPADYADGQHLARQLLTPEDPAAGTPHLGIEGRPFGYPVAISFFGVE
jgi:hypothetical protein